MKKKFVLVLLLSASLLLSFLPVYANASYTGVRAFFEGIGASVEWISETRSVVITTADSKSVNITIGSNVAYIDGQAVTLSAPPILENSRTMIPTDFLSQFSAVDNETQGSRALIAYFSLTGNAEFVTNHIKSLTGADVFIISPELPYSVVFEETLERATSEREAGVLPELSEMVDNLDDYDLIFLGSPNWFGTLSLPMLSFLDTHDLSGKTIAPFITFGMGGLQNTITDLKALLPEAIILEAFGISGADIETSQPLIEEWLESLGLL